MLTAGIAAAVVSSAVTPAVADTVEAPDSNAIAQELESDGVFIDPSIDAIPAAEEGALEAAAAGADVPVYYVILPTDAINSDSALNALMEPVMSDVGDGLYGVLAGSEEFRVLSPDVEDTEAIREIALREGGGNQIDTLVAVPDAAQQVEDSAAAGATTLWVLLLIVVLIGVGIVLYVRNNRRKEAERKAKELAEIKQMATEDVVRLGEDVARLEIDISAVDDDTRTDYSRAMDAYDQAKSRLDTIREPEEIRQVTNSLEDGRYYMTATRARLNGDPVPERRGPCFFNPQHGPSVEDVTWAPPGGSPRAVPACAVCAQAVNSGMHPDDVRLVEVDGRRVPYYDAGPAYSPYAGGYFGMDMMMGMFAGMMMGSMMGSMMGMGMGMGDPTGDVGAEGDFGGGDFGGGDFGDGGGDFGGFDF
ncbi:chemotaxis protein CheA [Nocardiopsis lambiniae]|uniref:Chemotaxis protein CheA n=1 Tax=Nocardiopsis lambiniae TaxID=3075539 RepID=A0ABU2M952_9ACTN|nr:chemotaxis protein CheA [Nocardiopsis sp. DSM 44743]MDT0329137.1 chemotaxis protein CheA [Nocardiopsis sp. DSM 44743]